MRPRELHGGAGTLVLCIALFLASAGCEPSIEGRVTDWATGDPTAGAHVFYTIFAYDDSYNYSEGVTVDIQL
jgi:hypothetical protein